MTSSATTITSLSRHPPLMLPTICWLRVSSNRAPSRRYVEPRTPTIVASAIGSPLARKRSIASRISINSFILGYSILR